MPQPRLKRLSLTIAFILLFVPPVGAIDPAPKARPRPDEIAAAALPRDVETIPGTAVTIELVRVPGGIFDFGMGNEQPRPVAVTGFWIGRTEVTWEQFDAFAHVRNPALLADPARVPPRNPLFGFGFEKQPALGMTRRHAEAYCEWLSGQTGKKYRLPTEVEWEYACRAGGAHTQLQGAALDKVAWHKDNSANNNHPDGTPHPVSQKVPNRWGLHDMLGNVVEWVTTADGKLVVRGGSWDHPRSYISCSKRFPQTAKWNVSDPQRPKSTWWLSDGKFVGFRVVREID